MQGITFNEIAQAIDILELDYANQDVRLSGSVVGELMKVLVGKFPDRAISMEIARSAPFSMFGSVVQGARSDIQLGLNEICCTFTDGVMKSESSSG